MANVNIPKEIIQDLKLVIFHKDVFKYVIIDDVKREKWDDIIDTLIKYYVDGLNNLEEAFYDEKLIDKYIFVERKGKLREAYKRAHKYFSDLAKENEQSK